MSGAQLQRWRAKAKVSGEELARALNVTRTTIYRWECRKELTPKMLRQLQTAARRFKTPLP